MISSDVTVIDGVTNTTTTLAVGNLPRAIAVNLVTGKTYVANSGGNSVTVFDATSTTTVPVDTNPVSVSINPSTNRIYVANKGSSSVTVIFGATNATDRIPVGTQPGAIAVNPATNKIYVNTLINAADGAMYQAKAGGKNRFEVAKV